MEQSFVKLRIAEKEERLKKEMEKENKKPVNGTMAQQKDGKYYLVRLEMEKEKISSLINAAEMDSRLSQLSDEASGKIRTAIGKAQLLLRKRFQQFRELCRDNIENDPLKKETKPSDLQGYWDMMFIQIEDVSSLFGDLQKMKANNWESLEKETTDGALKPKETTNGSLTPKNKRKSPNGKSPRSKNKNNNVDDEKVKREARNRLAAARKQAKLRMQEEAAANGNGSSLDNSWTVESTDEKNDSTCTDRDVVNDSTCTNGDEVNDSTCNEDISLNSSINTEYSLNSSNSSSVELLSNGSSSNTECISPPPSIVEPIPPVAIEVNGCA